MHEKVAKMTAGACKSMSEAVGCRRIGTRRSNFGSRYGFVSATLYLKMSDAEAESDVGSLVGLASLASSPARSCGLGSLDASDDDDAAGDEERPVPFVISTSAAIFIDVR